MVPLTRRLPLVLYVLDCMGVGRVAMSPRQTTRATGARLAELGDLVPRTGWGLAGCACRCRASKPEPRQVEEVASSGASAAELTRVKKASRANLMEGLLSNISMAGFLCDYTAIQGSWRQLVRQAILVWRAPLRDLPGAVRGLQVKGASLNTPTRVRKWVFPCRDLDHIDSITPEDVRRVADATFRPSNRFTGIVDRPTKVPIVITNQL